MPAMPTKTAKVKRRTRRFVGVLGLVAVGLLASACELSYFVVDTAANNRVYGRGPVQSVVDGADAWVSDTSRNTCELQTVELAAMMLTPTLLEAGDSNPSPMTLSRWDNISAWSINRSLFAFKDPSGANPYINAFFSPGIGLWQFDSAGGWNLTAGDAINVDIAAATAAAYMGSRYCAAARRGVQSPALRRQEGWSAWYCGRLLGGSIRDCESKYQSLLLTQTDPADPNRITSRQLDFTLNAAVSSMGGMESRKCGIRDVAAPIDCYRVDPAKAQGSTGWANWGTYDPSRTNGVTPLPKPFYVFRYPIGGVDYEYRVWMSAETGYDINITARHPVTTNARTSIEWFNSTTVCDTVTRAGDCGNFNPEGVLDSVTQDKAGNVHVAGWAFDRDTTNPIAVHIYVGSTGYPITANSSRVDVGVAYPGVGNNRGFDAQIPAPVGNQSVCAYAVNAGGGTTNVLLGCKSISVSGLPQGSLDAIVVSPGSISVTGWVYVPGLPSASAVVSVDGQIVRQVAPTITRTDVQGVIPGATPVTGFTTTIPLAGGSRRVCLTAGFSAPDAAGCRTVSLPTGAPFGALDVAVAGPGTISVGGWAIDPDTNAPIAVHVYVNSFGTALVANGTRTDVGGVYPAYGKDHGFNASIPVPTSMLGTRVNVCAYGIDVGGSVNTLLGCRTTTLPTGAPFGSVDAVSRTANGVYVAGWAIDPDTSQPVPVHVYVGAQGTALLANGNRPDVAAAFNGYGPSHGFSATLPLPAGPTQVCLYAIETAGTGSNRLLGCRTV